MQKCKWHAHWTSSSLWPTSTADPGHNDVDKRPPWTRREENWSSPWWRLPAGGCTEDKWKLGSNGAWRPDGKWNRRWVGDVTEPCGTRRPSPLCADWWTVPKQRRRGWVANTRRKSRPQESWRAWLSISHVECCTSPDWLFRFASRCVRVALPTQCRWRWWCREV